MDERMIMNDETLNPVTSGETAPAREQGVVTVEEGSDEENYCIDNGIPFTYPSGNYMLRRVSQYDEVFRFSCRYHESHLIRVTRENGVMVFRTAGKIRRGDETYKRLQGDGYMAFSTADESFWVGKV